MRAEAVYVAGKEDGLSFCGVDDVQRRRTHKRHPAVVWVVHAIDDVSTVLGRLGQPAGVLHVARHDIEPWPEAALGLRRIARQETERRASRDQDVGDSTAETAGAAQHECPPFHYFPRMRDAVVMYGPFAT